MLINVLRDEAPTHLGVAFDVSRTDIPVGDLPGVQGQPVHDPNEFKGQVDLVKEVLKRSTSRLVQKAGFEADDVIGTLATQAEAAGLRRADLHRRPGRVPAGLRQDTVLYPRKGVSDLARMTPATVEETVLRHSFPELAALVGESSDNLPGVPGWGRRPRPSGWRSTTAWRTWSPTRAS